MQKSPKIRHLGTIAQLCRAMSSQLRHVSIIGKKLLNQQYFPHMSSEYGELRSTSGWDRFGCLWHSSEFQRVSRLGSVTARYSSSGRQRVRGSLTIIALYKSTYLLTKLCGVEHRALPIFGRAAITLGIGPHSSWLYFAPIIAWSTGQRNNILCSHKMCTAGDKQVNKIQIIEFWRARRFHRATHMLWPDVQPSVSLSQADVLSKWLHKYNQLCMLVLHCSFSIPNA